VRTGDNSAASGSTEPEYLVERSSDHNTMAQHLVWDPSPTTAFDSLAVGFVLNAGPGGGANGVSFRVGNGPAAVHNGVTYDRITQVAIASAVTNTATRAMHWLEINVEFRMNGAPTQPAFSVSPNCLPKSGNGSIFSSGSSSGGSSPQVLVLTPAAGTQPNELVVSGSLRLGASSPTPGPDDMTGAIYVLAATCGSV
jgi:hypothetical protein